MAGDDIASPALNNSKLILKEQRKLLSKTMSMEIFSQHVLIITKGKAARRRKKNVIDELIMTCLVLVFAFMSRSLHDNVC